ncbi:hypothetical protein PENTCL1PPCAC_11654, partial [Pristionchus entomophagus]
ESSNVPDKKEPEDNLYKRREFYHPRRLAKLAGLDRPQEPFYVAEHHDKFQHTDRVMNSFCYGLAAFG